MKKRPPPAVVHFAYEGNDHPCKDARSDRATGRTIQASPSFAAVTCPRCYDWLLAHPNARNRAIAVDKGHDPRQLTIPGAQ